MLRSQFTSFEEERTEERATWQRAFMLARSWDVDHLLSEETMASILEEVEECLHQRLATSAILGSTDMARTEYALQQLSREAAGRGWDANLFHEVLTGIRSDPALLGKVLTFDCCVLYACWEVVHAPEGDPDPDVLFGHLSRLREVRRLVNKERGTHHYLQDDKDTEKARLLCALIVKRNASILLVVTVGLGALLCQRKGDLY